MSDRPCVVQTEDLDAQAAAWLKERCELVPHRFDAPGFDDALAKADGAVVRTYTKVDAAFLARAPRLKVVGRAGVGLDNIDVAACRARGVEVVHTPDANSSAVVEFVFALLFDLIRPRMFLSGAISADRWNQVRRDLRAPVELSELTLGVYGMGRVGSRVARAGVGFGMRVLYHDVREIPKEARFGAVPASREDLLRASDILTIHVDGRKGNRHLMNAGAFALMKDNAIFVNMSRGMVVDPAALAAFLITHPEARGVVDVHDPEPVHVDNPLLGLPNARLTPHLAAATLKSQTNMSWVVRDIWRVLSGETPQHPAPK